MKRIPLSAPHMGDSEAKFVQDAFASNWLSTVGPNLRALEQEFTARIGLPAVALSSGTAAIHLGLHLLGVGPGDEVFCPSLTFVASANPILYLGARPVFIDSEPESWNLDPVLLLEALEERARRRRLPKAVIVVDLFGQSANMDPIIEACGRFGIPVLEDAAEALGATYKGLPAGCFGKVGVFSLNGNKIITASGGGILLSQERDLVERARFLSTQARDPGIGYQHSEVGFNYAMSNVLAGIACGQLQVLDLRIQQRRNIAAQYRAAFFDLDGIAPMPEAAWGQSNKWLSCFLISPEFGCSRDELVAHLDRAGIESRPAWRALHLQPLYASAARYGGSLAEDISARGICLPSSSNLSAEDQDRVITAVRAAATRAAASKDLSRRPRQAESPRTSLNPGDSVDAKIQNAVVG